MDVEPFGPGSLHWETAGEYRNLLVAGSALVLQTMHPAVGAAVAQHSTYKEDPWGRLNRTLASVQKWVYAGAGGLVEGERLREIHKPISGVDEQGRSYHALNGEAWAWVHLSLFERFVALNRHFGTPYTEECERRLYQEARQLGAILRVPGREMPDSVEAFWRYFDTMLAERLEPHPTALEVLAVMRGTPAPPGLPRPLRRLWTPLGVGSGEFNHFVTVGTLPPLVREKLGLRWSARDERRLRRLGAAVAMLVP
ncbi:oxygenase MpaB family protein, partial [Nonomuraea rhizosphaerae]|uniref:oxygenase MpaB family protein n=1 Tax=Nonomuraea rhizosphaerae TaxID=2665663 RepID=UPI001C5D9A10